MSETLKICIGYDDHMSVYAVTKEMADTLMGMYDTDKINDYIVGEGTYLDVTPDQFGDAFLDITDDSSLDWFHDEMATAMIIAFRL